MISKFPFPYDTPLTVGHEYVRNFELLILKPTIVVKATGKSVEHSPLGKLTPLAFRITSDPALSITSDHLWDVRDQLPIPICLRNRVETNPKFKQQCILFISVKIWSLTFLSSSHLIFQVPLPHEVFPRCGYRSHWLRNSFTGVQQVPWELVSWKWFT